uniref:Uncharacterized protein n=1 Tax=Cuerna arida TaxID=1464854 RepID=A0A1B6F1L4_9HEMI
MTKACLSLSQSPIKAKRQELFRTFGILTAVSIYISEAILHLYKIYPLTCNGEIHRRNTRSANNFNLPLHRTTVYSKKLSYAGANIFNLLPAKVKNGPADGLRKRIQQWLAKDPVYSLEEFI